MNQPDPKSQQPQSQPSAESILAHQQQCQSLIEQQQTAVLATVSPSGEPLSSYAPFHRDADGVFYIFISELAEHTRNLADNPKASVFLIEPESEAKNPFARRRAVFQCRAERIPRDANVFSQVMAAMTEHFGDTVALLQSLADFHLYALHPNKGTYVAGFGQAFELNLATGEFIHIAPTNSSSSSTPRSR